LEDRPERGPKNVIARGELVQDWDMILPSSPSRESGLLVPELHSALLICMIIMIDGFGDLMPDRGDDGRPARCFLSLEDFGLGEFSGLVG
jgi:hypothetical protein